MQVNAMYKQWQSNNSFNGIMAKEIQNIASLQKCEKKTYRIETHMYALCCPNITIFSFPTISVSSELKLFFFLFLVLNKNSARFTKYMQKMNREKLYKIFQFLLFWTGWLVSWLQLLAMLLIFPLLLLLLLIHHLVFSTCAYICVCVAVPLSFTWCVCVVHLCWNSSREKLLEIKLPSNDLSPWAGTPFYLKDRISFLRMASSSAFCMDVTKMDSYLHYRPNAEEKIEYEQKETTAKTIITHTVRQYNRKCMLHILSDDFFFHSKS